MNQQCLGPLQPLAAYHQFIVYRAVPHANGKTNKIPCSAESGAPASALDPANHLDYETACAAADRLGPQFGVGFVLTDDDDLWCLDLDNCLTETGWSQTALDVLALLPGTVCEVSRSGRGVHVWGRGLIPEHRSRNTTLGMDLYSRGRFIALGDTENATGGLADHVPGIETMVERYFAPTPTREAAASHGDGPCPEWRGPTDDDDLIRRACMATSAASVFDGNAVTFHDLWTRNAPALARRWPGDRGEPFNATRADVALACHLAFWTGRDASRMERIMLRADNGLRRDKYDRADYLPRTIAAVLKLAGDVCQDKAPDILASAPAA